MVGCRANEIENLFTAEPRVASEKEKNRDLKCIKANRKRVKRRAKEGKSHAGKTQRKSRGVLVLSVRTALGIVIKNKTFLFSI